MITTGMIIQFIVFGVNIAISLWVINFSRRLAKVNKAWDEFHRILADPSYIPESEREWENEHK